MRSEKRRAFTLVELMIAVLILGESIFSP
ncbi:MAG: prepilin-type N-terminal cleavage/methylation domain-containing protein [Planctomycetota bacterium]